MPDCGKINGKIAAGCEAENLTSVRLVELDKTLYLSGEGFLTLTYRGPLRLQSGEFRKYAVEMDADTVQTFCEWSSFLPLFMYYNLLGLVIT